MRHLRWRVLTEELPVVTIQRSRARAFLFLSLRLHLIRPHRISPDLGGLHFDAILEVRRLQWEVEGVVADELLHPVGVVHLPTGITEDRHGNNEVVSPPFTTRIKVPPDEHPRNRPGSHFVHLLQDWLGRPVVHQRTEGQLPPRELIAVLQPVRRRVPVRLRRHGRGKCLVCTRHRPKPRWQPRLQKCRSRSILHSPDGALHDSVALWAIRSRGAMNVGDVLGRCRKLTGTVRVEGLERILAHEVPESPQCVVR